MCCDFVSQIKEDGATQGTITEQGLGILLHYDVIATYN